MGSSAEFLRLPASVRCLRAIRGLVWRCGWNAIGMVWLGAEGLCPSRTPNKHSGPFMCEARLLHVPLVVCRENLISLGGLLQLGVLHIHSGSLTWKWKIAPCKILYKQGVNSTSMLVPGRVIGTVLVLLQATPSATRCCSSLLRFSNHHPPPWTSGSAHGVPGPGTRTLRERGRPDGRVEREMHIPHLICCLTIKWKFKIHT